MSIASRVGLAPKKDSIAKDVGLDKSKSDAISPGTPIGSGKDGGTIVYDPKSPSGGKEVDMSPSPEYTKPKSSSRSSRSSKSSSSSKVVKEVPEPTPPKEPDMSSRQDVDRYNKEVNSYNRELKVYQSQFVRPDGFKPGEPLYLELRRDGLKDDVLVKDDDGSTLRRSGLSIDAKKFEEDIEKEKKRVQDAKLKDAKDSFRSAREASKPDPNKQLFGSREPGKETISDKPTYKVYDPNTIVLSPTQTAEFLAVRTFLPKYRGITKEEYKRDVFGRGSPARVLSDTGDKMISEFKGLRWEDRMRPKGFVKGQSLTVGALSAIGNQEASDFYKEREASWMSLTDKTGRVLTKGASVVGQVVGESVKDPVSDVVLFGVGGVVGKTAKVLKPVAVRYSAFVGSRSVPVRSALKGAGIGLKTSAVGVIGGSVVMDVARADDPALRTAQITKDFALLGAGFRAGQRTKINFAQKTKLDSAPVRITQSTKGSTRQFPEGFKQIDMDFNIKSPKVKSGKSPMSKASIRRQSRGLPKKGQQFDKINIKGEEFKVKTQDYWMQTKKEGRVVIEQIKEVNIKPTRQQRVKYEGFLDFTKTRPPSQAGYKPVKFKEVASARFNQGSSVLLQEQRQKQLLTINIKKLSASKPNRIYTGKDLYKQSFKKQQLNINKGLVSQSSTPVVPSTSSQPVLSETIGKSQGRDKVVQKILDRARAKAEASKKTTETLIKPKPQQQSLSTQRQTVIQDTKQEIGQSPFESLTKKKKTVLVEQETFTAPRVSMDGKISDANLIVPIISIRSAVSSAEKFAFQPSITSNSISALRSETTSAQIISPSVRSVQRVESGNMLDQAVVQDQARSTQTSITPIQTSRSRSPTPTPTPDPIIRNPNPIIPEPKPPQIKPPKTSITQPPELKNPKPPRIPTNNIPSGGREPSLGAGFVVSVRRGGVFSPVGFFSSPAEAFSKGQSVVGGTAGASFKVSDPKGQVIPTSSFNLGNRFRPSKKERGVIVERRKYRISSPGELEEITYKGLMAQRTKRSKGGFNLF